MSFFEPLEPRCFLSAAPIADPVVSIKVNRAYIVEGGHRIATITVSRTGPHVEPLAVGLSFSGAATLGQDYSVLDSVTIPAGKSKIKIPLTSIEDTDTEGDESINVTLNTGAYVKGVDSASLTLRDNDYAPYSLTSTTVNAKISGGMRPFARRGSYQLFLTPSTQQYILIGGPGVASSSGTYTYQRLGPLTGQITFNDSATGQGSASLTFTSPTRAKFYFTSAVYAGYQKGVMTFV